MNQKKWDAYIYGDVNIDLVVPGVEHFPAPDRRMRWIPWRPL